jgi:hypothetical protein
LSTPPAGRDGDRIHRPGHPPLKRFAKAFRVHICVVAHPTKSSKDGDGNYKMPTLYDISKRGRIPREIKSAPAFIKRAFLMAYLSGDGCAKGDGFAASTVSAALRDDLQRLSLELGLPCSWSAIAPAKPHHSPCWQINIGHDGRAKTALQTHRNRTIQHYDGLVWCLTVPTGAYFVRRKGKALACGNSANWYNKADLGVIVHRENEDDTLIKVQKSRYHEVIGKPGEVRMQFSKDERRFVEIERVA